MKTIAHLSDLHFGRVDAALLDPLAESVRSANPDVVVVSGDLTQRAKTKQFVEAAAFLERLPSPQVVVPGNHDVPLYNLALRFFAPLERYRRHISPDLCPSFVDAGLAVLGINTARSLVLKNGRINEEQAGSVRATLSALDSEVIKVVVTHHPFDVGPDAHHQELVGRAKMAMQQFAECGVDLLLAGHLHVSHSNDTGGRYALSGYEALVVSAGTATSTHNRGQANSFNLLRLEKRRIEVERHEWQPAAARFACACRETFVRRGGGWEQA